MATTPRIVSSHFPYLPVQVRIHAQTFDFEALLDTGFDGALAVPSSFLGSAGAPEGYQTWFLADGTPVIAAVYRGTAQVGGLQQIFVLITALGDEPLIGLEIIRRFHLTLERGERVILQL